MQFKECIKNIFVEELCFVFLFEFQDGNGNACESKTPCLNSKQML